MKTKKEELQAELTRLNDLRKQVKEKLKALPLLEVGKWYWISNIDTHFEYMDKNKVNALVFNNGEERSYGFNFIGTWSSNFYLKGNIDLILRLATAQEVEKALIEEAKMRGFVNGSTGNNSNIHETNLEDCELFFNNEYEFDEKENLLRVVLDAYTTWTVFENGKWATIIEQDKFAELKEAHRNGAVIQWRREKFGNLIWEDCNENEPAWVDFNDYRIKPEEKPKVGDVVKCWYNDSPTEFLIKIADAEDLTIFQNIKAITKQEAIDLLFNKGAN